MTKKEKALTHGPEYEEFGKNLANARNKLKLSQLEMAQALNMNQSTYSGYETGTRKVPLSVIRMISEFLKISPTTLIYGDESNTYFTEKSLSYEDSLILQKYHSLSPEKKEVIHAALGIDNLNITKKNDEHIA